MLSRADSRVAQAVSAFDNHDRFALSLPPPIPSRGHQRSRTTIDLPPLFTRTSSVSPDRSSTFLPFNRKSRDPSPVARPFTATSETSASASETQRKPKLGAAGKIASWFDGASEPVNITLVPSPKKEIVEPFYQVDHSNEIIQEATTSMDNLTQRPRTKNATGQTSANSSKFSFFRKATTSQAKADPDELVHMDIREALLPDGTAVEITPATYKKLQLSAEALLRRFQASYAENLGALRQITSEKHIQNDDFDAAQTRNEHLKLQLLEMAEKASEQERIIASLKTQLAEPQPSVRMITENDQYASRSHRHRTRVSDVSTSDESFVDSEMSSAISIFSDVESISTPPSSVAPSPRMKHTILHNPRIMHEPPIQAQRTPLLVSECQNCHNVSASEAWDVVEMMKMENTCLKERIGELETANDAALDILSTLNQEL